MVDPTARLRLIPNDTPVVSVNTPAKRLAAIAGELVVATGNEYEADLGTIDISEGAENSDVLTFLWDITNDGGYTGCSLFKLWLSSNGFDQAGTVIKVQPLSGADQGAPANTENYIVDAVVGSYTWATMVESLPGAINVWPSDEGVTMTMPGTFATSDDAIMFAIYLAVADGETCGEYKNSVTGFELQLSFKYDYS